MEGNTLTYTNWGKGQPNNYNKGQDYASIYFGDGKWGDFQDDPRKAGFMVLLHHPMLPNVVCLQELD